MLNFTLRLINKLLSFLLPPTHPTPALKSAARALNANETEALWVAETSAQIETLQFRATPIIPPAARIVSWVELPERQTQNPQITALKEELRAPEISPNRVEVLEVPEISPDLSTDLSDILAIEETAIAPLEPTPIALEPVPEVAEVLEVSEVSEISQISPLPDAIADLTRTNKPIKRGDLVRALLDEAWAQGFTNYQNLSEYVQNQTGTACSKKIISAWKKDRGLATT